MVSNSSFDPVIVVTAVQHSRTEEKVNWLSTILVNAMEPRARLKITGDEREYERTFDSKASKACILRVILPMVVSSASKWAQ